MVPAVVTIIPLYAMFTAAGLRNTFWALVLPQVFGSPYAIFLLREYFRGIPEDLVSAARLDGCSTLQVLWHVVVPVSRPILATLTIITVVSHWNNFLWPLVITSGPKWQTLTLATANLQSQYNGNWTLVMAATRWPSSRCSSCSWCSNATSSAPSPSPDSSEARHEIPTRCR